MRSPTASWGVRISTPNLRACATPRLARSAPDSPEGNPREGLNNPHLGRNAIGCGSKIRFEDLSER